MALSQLLQAAHSHALAVNRRNLRQRTHAIVTDNLQLRTRLHTQHLADVTRIHTRKRHFIII